MKNSKNNVLIGFVAGMAIALVLVIVGLMIKTACKRLHEQDVAEHKMIMQFEAENAQARAKNANDNGVFNEP